MLLSSARGFAKSQQSICLAIIILVGAFYLVTIRAGQLWPDDFAMYIHEARNLAERVPLNETGYIYNRYNPSVGPRLYPPVFPVLLIPGYLTGGLNDLTPMKVEIVVFFVAILFVLWRGLGSDLPLLHRAALLGIVGFNPLLWDFKDSILSDIPFTFLLYLTLVLADRLQSGSRSASERLWRTLALGGLVYLCYGARTFGIVLVPALVLSGLMNWARGGRSLVGAAGLGLVLCLIQQTFLGAEATYLDQLKLPLAMLVTKVLRNVIIYTWSLATFWQNPYTRVLRDIVLLVVTLLALLAYFRRVRTAPRIYEIFLTCYLSLVLFWPNPGGSRYLIPIFPLYVFYSLDGIETLKRWLKVHGSEPILVPLLVLVFMSYAAEFMHLDFGPFKEGIGKKESTELFSFIRSNTDPKDVFIFRRPRALALFTGRSASIYPESQNGPELCRYSQMIGATYLIGAPSLDDPGFTEFLTREFPQKQLLFSNSDFCIFHIRPPDLKECAEEAPDAHSPSAHLP